MNGDGARLFDAAWVLPVAAPPIRDGVVAVRDGRIVWVGAGGAADAPAGERHALGPGVLLPGLVNAHCHLELSALAGRLDASRGFTAWIEALVEARAQLPREVAREATDRAIRALEAGGTVALGDVSNALDHIDLLERSTLTSVVFFEQLGWDPAQAKAILDQADARLASVGSQPAANVVVRLAAHAPHSVSPELMAGLVARGGPAALHLAESPDETRFLARGDGAWSEFLRRRVGALPFTPPGSSPVAYADSLGVLRPGVVAAHCVHAGAADIATLRARGVHAVLCPRSNLALGVGLPPLEVLLEAGTSLALGTDSLASAPSLELLEDARVLHRAFPRVPAATLVEMATAGGARALGLRELGSLLPGQRAALAFAAAPGAVSDACAFLLSDEARVTRVAA